MPLCTFSAVKKKRWSCTHRLPCNLAEVALDPLQAAVVGRPGRLVHDSADRAVVARRSAEVAPRQGHAPVIVVEGAGEMIGVAGAVALGAVMGVVEMRRDLVAPEAAVVRARSSGRSL